VAACRAVADDSESWFEAGQTGLVIEIPEAEPVLRAWRDRLDPSARAGAPAHITVLFPFLAESRVDGAALAAVFGGHRRFDLRFTRFGRFPGVLYLAPEPAEPLRRLTAAIVARWPEAPPYGGQFPDDVPHLTIANGQDDAALDAAEADVVGHLPITSHVSSVALMAYDGVRWRQKATFALGE
jgi:2'-5' RNA ligase